MTQKRVVEAVQQKLEDDTYFGLIISEIKATIACFEACNIKHICRNANVVADHTLGKNALSTLDYIVDMEDPPLCIHSFLYNR